MVLNNIEQLIEKYNNAETTLQEEAQLKTYFSSDHVAPHLEHFKPMFQYFSQSKKEQYTKDVPLKPKKTKLYQWISIAAVAVIMLGLLIPTGNSEPKSLADYPPEDQQLYLEAKQALAMLSNNFKDGATSLKALNLASENFNVGLKKANHITEFNESTSRLLKN
ncbi:hypothetical protein DFQ11_103200 [Winogradskyella epiphytica]|uniref:Uncharacterized protein n=1 Tax=Winogradskyella epiphytica TaxID=262005 RepID=A0A2V4X728_9FLAO|nr:hypothetical protein [Winogradskyella epiphytica]PYE81119.1 hypothetical protein DFQ11_103200 [Winogradskyella epiphytica]GGW66990.1 hypothetical protein GCM10008085_18610 [Winogradskyella epiphytica]